MIRVKQLIALFLVIGVGFSAAHTRAADKSSLTKSVIQIATGEYPPWVSESQPQMGFISAIITRAFALENIQVRYVFMPWKRAYQDTSVGKYDATSYWYPSRERQQQFLYSDVLYTQEEHFFYHTAKPLKEWNDLEDLRHFKIGLSDGYTYIPELWKAGATGLLQIETAMGDDLNLAKLLQRRIDLFPVDRRMALQVLRTMQPKPAAGKLAYHPKPLVVTTSHLLFPKVLSASGNWRQSFNAGLKQLTQRGDYDALVKQFEAGDFDATTTIDVEAAFEAEIQDTATP